MKKLILAILACFSIQANAQTPAWLQSYEKLYKKDPHAANLQWFRDSRFGMFIHWGASTAYEKGEWVMYNQKIPIGQYQQKAMRFTGRDFNADSIVDLAVRAQMKYIAFVVRHHDGFSLYNTKAGPFSSVNADSHRDYLRDLAAACKKRKLGLFIYYSIGIDWTHPFYLTRDYYSAARPNYAVPDTAVRFRNTDDFAHYWNYVKTQIYELCTEYGDIAGLWFDTIGGCYANPELFRMDEIYAMMRRLQPHALVTFKTGFNGDEDFLSCEHEIKPLTSLMQTVQGGKVAAIASAAWEKNKAKPAELCTTMQSGGWGYVDNAKHKSAEEVYKLLEVCAANNANLLMNIGPLPEGGIHPEDWRELVKVGDMIRKNGFPKADTVNYMKLRETKKTDGGRDFETAK